MTRILLIRPTSRAVRFLPRLRRAAPPPRLGPGARRVEELAPLPELEDDLHLLLERQRGEPAAVPPLALDEFADVRVLLHAPNLASFARHFSVRPCRRRTASSRAASTAPCSRNILIR